MPVSECVCKPLAKAVKPARARASGVIMVPAATGVIMVPAEAQSPPVYNFFFHTEWRTDNALQHQPLRTHHCLPLSTPCTCVQPHLLHAPALRLPVRVRPRTNL